MKERNALKPSEFILVVRLPRISLLSKNIHTSGTIGRPLLSVAAAISMLVSRFSFPSVRSLPIGNCEPVMMTGLARFSSMKLRAEAVYAIVSVPWSSTNPS